MYVKYDTHARYKFACEFLDLSLSEEEKKRVEYFEGSSAFNLENDTLARLLQRINDEKLSVVLPSLKAQRCLITAPTRRQLEQVKTRVGHLLIPTYAIIDPAGHERFSYGKKKYLLQRLGEQLYPEGYYVLHFHKKHEQTVLERLRLWVKLEEESQQPRSTLARPTYGNLYGRFRAALAATQWEDAEAIRKKLLISNLTSADNLLFLEIEQYAQQGRWAEISEHRDFTLLTRMQTPRSVRAALITAFHQTYLLPHEQQGEWQQALDSFKENQPRLGQLLTARLGLKQDAIIQIYVYQAVLDRDLKALLDLKEQTSSENVQECIKQLLHLSHLEEEQALSEKTDLSPHTHAMEALYRHDYDKALLYAEEIEGGVEKTGLLLQIAYHTRDTKTAETALLSYEELETDQQEKLKQRFPSMGDVLNQLQQLLDIDHKAGLQQQTILDWLTWFERVQENPDDPQLLYAIDRLTAVSDERYWTIENIERLNKSLLNLLLDSRRTIKLSHVRDALYKLIIFFINSEDFPRIDSTYQQLYETLYVALLENQAQEELHTNFILLRLAEAQLRQSPKKCLSILQNLKDWSGNNPIPKLNTWVLDVFELLIEYGLQPGNLIDWYETWAPYIIANNTPHDRALLEGWYTVGQTIQPRQDLLQQIGDSLKDLSAEEINKPIEELPEKYRITIYSLQIRAAERAKKILLERNSELRIHVCPDEVLSKSAKANAQNSDLIVLVTTAMKHALFYSLGPSIQADQVVYPESSGSTSIVRAIEEFAMRCSNQ